MRPIWTGAIGFGLVNIPVKLFSAAQASELDLDMVDKRDHANIKFQRVNEKTGKVVEWENITKAYMMDEQYVILDDEDFEKANAEKTKSIDITDFVDETEIDSVYFETPYYVVPDKSGVRAYYLFKNALLKTGKAGIATFVMRNKEGIAVLRATKEIIILNRMRFGEEIRDPADLEMPKAPKSSDAELKMAVSLIQSLSGKFDPAKYKDTYTAELLKLIKAKAKTGVAPVRKMKVVSSKTDDLMAALKASLEGGGSKKKKAS